MTNRHDKTDNQYDNPFIVNILSNKAEMVDKYSNPKYQGDTHFINPSFTVINCMTNINVMPTIDVLKVIWRKLAIWYRCREAVVNLN